MEQVEAEFTNLSLLTENALALLRVRVMSGDQIPNAKNPHLSGFLVFQKPMSTTANSMGFFRGRQPGFTQAFGVVITWCRGRNSAGLGDATGIGVGETRGRGAMTVIVIALTTVVVPAPVSYTHLTLPTNREV